MGRKPILTPEEKENYFKTYYKTHPEKYNNDRQKTWTHCPDCHVDVKNMTCHKATNKHLLSLHKQLATQEAIEVITAKTKPRRTTHKTRDVVA